MVFKTFLIGSATRISDPMNKFNICYYIHEIWLFLQNSAIADVLERGDLALPSEVKVCPRTFYVYFPWKEIVFGLLIICVISQLPEQLKMYNEDVDS